MVIRVAEITDGANTTEEGLLVFDHLTTALKQSDCVEVSFDGVKTATSSFANTAFVALLDVLNLDEFKRRIKITNSTRQINEMIKYCLMRAALDNQPS